MKKLYITPSVKVFAITINNLMAGSNNPDGYQSNTSTNGNITSSSEILSRDQNDFWDDSED